MNETLNQFRSDWGFNIETNLIAIQACYGIISVLSILAIGVVCRHTYRHYYNPYKAEDKRKLIARNVALMALPPFIIGTYTVYQLITRDFLSYSLPMVMYLIVLQLTWAFSSFVIYKNQITMAQIATQNFKTKIDWVKPFLIVNSGLQFGVLSACLIALYITKSEIIYRVYTAYSTFYVLTHIVPIWGSNKLYSEIETQLNQFKKLNGDISSINRTIKTAEKIKNMRNSFYGTSLYLFNAIFIGLPQASPYYLIVVFAAGVISSFGAVNIYPYLGSKTEDTSVQSSVESANSNVSMINNAGSRADTLSGTV